MNQFVLTYVASALLFYTKLKSREERAYPKFIEVSKSQNHTFLI